MEAAWSCALERRRQAPEFEDWAEEKWGGALPRALDVAWNSVDADNGDDDDYTEIRVMTELDFERARERDARIVKESWARQKQEQQRQLADDEARLQQAGEVHYSYPPPPHGADLAAEIELVVCNGGVFEAPRAEGMSFKLTPGRPALDLSRVAAVRTLMMRFVEAKDEAGAEANVAAAKRVLAAAASLKELHWHNACSVGEVLAGVTEAGECCGPWAPVETRITRELKVLSLPFVQRSVGPDNLETLKAFSALSRLDLRGSLDMEHGMHLGQGGGMFGYDSEEEEAEKEPMPYNQPLLAIAAANPGLNEIDLDGILDFDTIRYCLDDDGIDELYGHGVNLKLGKKAHY